MSHTAQPLEPPPPPAKDSLNIDRFIAEILADLKANRLELPTLPQLGAKINQVVGSRDATAKSIAKVVSADPALSARLLQVANSALVRSPRKIKNVHMAVTRMGATMVRNVVTSFLVRQLFRTNNKVLQKRLLEIWNHSAHVAAICFVLAEKCSEIKPDEAMLAGLLHDIGKLPILSKAKKLPLTEANTSALDSVLERLHCSLGKTILETWNFAPFLVTAAAEHENWRRDTPTLDHADIVVVANLHSHLGKPNRGAIPLLEVPAMNKLSLNPEQSIEILKQAHADITSIYQLFVTA